MNARDFRGIEESILPIANQCFDVIKSKIKIYGSSFRVMRSLSLNDQIKYKIIQLRRLEEDGESIDSMDDITTSIFNYSLMALFQLDFKFVDSVNNDNITKNEILCYFDNMIGNIIDVMAEKDVNYGNSWLWMVPCTFTDICLTKVERAYEMLITGVNESNFDSIKDVYTDICNYILFYKFRVK